MAYQNNTQQQQQQLNDDAWFFLRKKEVTKKTGEQITIRELVFADNRTGETQYFDVPSWKFQKFLETLDLPRTEQYFSSLYAYHPDGKEATKTFQENLLTNLA